MRPLSTALALLATATALSAAAVTAAPLPDALGTLTAALSLNDKGYLSDTEGLAEPNPFPLDAVQLDLDRDVMPSDFRALVPLARDLAPLRQQAASGPVRVIVTLRAQMGLAGRLGATAAAVQSAAYSTLQGAVLGRLQGRQAQVRHRYASLPQLAMTVDAAALEALARDPDVARVQEDRLSSPELAQSVPLIGAADVQDRGYDGNGRVVAVLDTGIDRDHPMLRGFVGEACFTWGDCPNGEDVQTGAGAAAACTDIPGCDHGTHVAGIAAGAISPGLTNAPGVAPGARIMPITVFSRWTGVVCSAANKTSPCLLSLESDQLAALEYVYRQRNNYPISSVNMSLGDSSANTGNCDSNALKPVIDQLRSVGIATVISSGNGGYTNAVGSPGCISSAITVGATDDNDAVASFSNSAVNVDLLAPGVAIRSSCLGGTLCSKNGTSMAAPHVAGAWALVHQQALLSVSSVGALLASKGTPITDTRSGAGNRVRPRIQTLAAMGLDLPNLADASPTNYRSPEPYRHNFQYQPAGASWSAIAVRSSAEADHGLYFFDGAPTVANQAILASSLAARNTVGVVVQNNTAGARPISRDYPQVLLTGGSGGRYSVELSDAAQTLSNVATGFLNANNVVRVWNLAATAGKPLSLRVRPSTGADLELMVFGSDPARSQPHLLGRSQARVVASAGGAGAAEALSFTPATTGTYAVVVTQRSGAGVFNLYRDDTAPTGSVVIAGGAATTTTRTVQLNLTASDAQTGVDSMRLCPDGTCDTESYIAYTSTPTVTLQTNTGTSKVAVQFRNGAGMPSPVYSDTIEVTARPITVSINDASAFERDGNSTDLPKLSFLVALSEVAPVDVTVTLATAVDGTATLSDYRNGTTRTVTIKAGTSLAFFPVLMLPDTEVEANETFTQNIASASFVTVADGSATGTILDDDASGPNYRVYVEVSNAVVAADSVGSVTATPRIRLTKPAVANAVTVSYGTADGTALAPADYTAVQGTATIAIGQSSVAVPVTIKAHSQGEGVEFFELRLSSVSGAPVVSDRGQIEIQPPPPQDPYY